MTEATEQDLQQAITAATAGQKSSLEVYQAAQDDAVARHADSVVKIEEADNTIHKIEGEIHDRQRDLDRWKNFRTHQVKRKHALERKIVAGRSFIRAIEDDELGLD